jgi:hypothetical protein
MQPEIAIRAEIRAGELYQEMEKALGMRGQFAGGKPGHGGKKGSGGAVRIPPENQSKTLAEHRMSKKQSSQFQAPLVD